MINNEDRTPSWVQSVMVIIFTAGLIFLGYQILLGHGAIESESSVVLVASDGSRGQVRGTFHLKALGGGAARFTGPDGAPGPAGSVFHSDRAGTIWRALVHDGPRSSILTFEKSPSGGFKCQGCNGLGLPEAWRTAPARVISASR